MKNNTSFMLMNFAFVFSLLGGIIILLQAIFLSALLMGLTSMGIFPVALFVPEASGMAAYILFITLAMVAAGITSIICAFIFRRTKSQKKWGIIVAALSLGIMILTWGIPIGPGMTLIGGLMEIINKK